MTADTDALVAFLRARLDELERLARDACPGPWMVDPHQYGLEDGGTYWDIDGPAGGWLAHLGEWADAQHIARHDPAQVLREVDAHRRIVDACVPHVIRADDCGQLARGTLVALALPHSSHPEYREEWRP